MRPSATHTYENFPKMFHSFYLADYSKVSTIFWDTRYIHLLFIKFGYSNHQDHWIELNNCKHCITSWIWVIFHKNKLVYSNSVQTLIFWDKHPMKLGTMTPDPEVQSQSGWEFAHLPTQHMHPAPSDGQPWLSPTSLEIAYNRCHLVFCNL